MKRFTLLLSAMLLACATSLWADVSTWTISGVETTATGGSDVNTALKATVTPDKETGKWTAVAKTSYAGNNKGAQLGSNSYFFNGTISLSNTAIPEEAVITEISITCVSNGNYTISAKVNDQTFGKSVSVSSTSTALKIAGNNTLGSGIVLTFSATRTKKNVIITAISVTYTLVTSPCTVTFNAGVNGTCSTVSLTETTAGAGVVLPTATANEGYKFVGWATTSDAITADAGKAGDTYKPASDVTLYAIYAEEVLIDWSVEGVSGDITSYTKGDLLVLPTTPVSTDPNKVFVGWTATPIVGTTDNAPTDLFCTPIPAVETATYYAVFAVLEGTVGQFSRIKSLDEIADNMSVAIVSNNNILNSSLSALTAPTETDGSISVEEGNNIWTVKKSSTNNKWNILSSTGSTLGAETLPTNSSSNKSIALTEQNTDWTIEEHNTADYFCLVLGADCALEYYSSKWVVYKTSSYTSNSYTNIALYKAAYKYYSYSTSKIYTYTIAEHLTNVSAEATNPAYLTAEDATGTTAEFTYTITSDYVWPTSIEVKMGGVTLEAGEDYIWETEGLTATLSIIPVTGNLEIIISAVLDDSKILVTYNLDGGIYEENTDNVVVAQKKDVAFALLASPTKTGYTFAGWLNNGTIYPAEQSVTLSKDEIFIAQWTINQYTVSFDANAADAEGATASVTGDYNTDVTLTENGFTREGYVFYRWTTKPNGSGNYYYDGKTLKLGAEDITLYAQWKKIHSVTWYINGKALTPKEDESWTTEVVDGEKVTILPPEPAGNTFIGTNEFAGWLDRTISPSDDRPEGIFVTAPTEAVKEDKEYHAVFVKATKGENSFELGKSGDFTIACKVGDIYYYATATISSNKLTSSSTKTDAAMFTFTYDNEGETYTIQNIQNGTNYYLNGKSGKTELSLTTSTYNWKISKGVHGSWRALLGDDNTRALIARVTETSVVFAGYAISNATATSTEYYDVEIGDPVIYTNYITSGTITTGLEDANQAMQRAVKRIENGQLIILRDGKKYNAMGIQL